MNRIVAAAALAALLAVPAAAKDIHVPVAGKSAAQIQADVTKAAKTLCLSATATATFKQTEMAACMKTTVASAMAKMPAAQLAQN